MLGDIIADALAMEPDLELVATCDRCEEVGTQSQPDVMLVGMAHGELSPECRRLLFDAPGARCLAVTHNGREAYLYELRPYRILLGELPSPKALIEMIRTAATVPPEAGHGH
jgi:hypothetical protein